MAVAQAQHAVRELAETLVKTPCDVNLACTSGRSCRHMNVLLAEAIVSYDTMMEMDDEPGDAHRRWRW